MKFHGENDYSIEKESCEAGDETGNEIIRPEGHFCSCTKTNNGKKNIDSHKIGIHGKKEVKFLIVLPVNIKDIL